MHFIKYFAFLKYKKNNLYFMHTQKHETTKHCINSVYIFYRGLHRKLLVYRRLRLQTAEFSLHIAFYEVIKQTYFKKYSAMSENP